MGKQLTDNFREFTTATQDYIESSISYHKLDLFKKVMKGVVSSSYQIILGFFFLIALIFLSVAMAIYLGNVLDNIALGYLIMGVFYILLMIVLSLFLKKTLEKILVKKASAQFFNDNEDIKIEQHEGLQ
ncbi:phage holin family protein [Nonlabens sp. Asnod3-A02]|uniref:phage holin family protein n=1 Tax=Nonlabens sp. Asnod3-A02 TaxID=3160579 RepID=UPI003867871A